MYFDAVLDKDMQPLFNDVPGKVKAWLMMHKAEDTWQVCIGRTTQIVSVKEYLS